MSAEFHGGQNLEDFHTDPIDRQLDWATLDWATCPLSLSAPSCLHLNPIFGEVRAMHRFIICCATWLAIWVAHAVIAENPAEVPAFGSTFASLGFLDQKGSTALPETMLTMPGAIEGFRLGGPTTALRVVQIEEERYAIRLGNSDVSQEFPASYDGFAVFTLDLNADGRDEVLVESGFGRGTDVYQRRLAAYRVVDGDFKTIFDATLNNYFAVAGEIFPGGWARRYRLMQDTASQQIEIVLVLEVPATPVSTPDADAQLVMSRREMRFAPDENGMYKLAARF